MAAKVSMKTINEILNVLDDYFEENRDEDIATYIFKRVNGE